MRLSPQMVQRFLPTKTRMLFYKALAVHMENGLNVLGTLTLLRKRVPKGVWLHESLIDIAIERIEAGATLGQALKGCIPNMEYMIIHGSDSTHHQAKSLELVADLSKVRARIRQSVQTALGYPILLYLLLLILLIVVALFVVPAFLEFIPLSQWNGNALILYKISHFFTSWYGYLSIVIVFSLGTLSFYSLSRWVGIGRVPMEKYPPWSLYRLLASSIWLVSLSTMLHGGIRTGDALAISLKSSGSAWLTNHLESVNSHYARGKDLGQSLIETKNFLAQDINEEVLLYAILPNFAQKLPTLSQQWLEEQLLILEKTSKRFNFFGVISILGFLIFVTLAVHELVTMMSTMPLTF